MNVYEHQRLRSFSDLGTRSLGLHVNQHFKGLLILNCWALRGSANSKQISYAAILATAEQKFVQMVQVT